MGSSAWRRARLPCKGLCPVHSGLVAAPSSRPPPNQRLLPVCLTDVHSRYRIGNDIPYPCICWRCLSSRRHINFDTPVPRRSGGSQSWSPVLTPRHQPHRKGGGSAVLACEAVLLLAQMLKPTINVYSAHKTQRTRHSQSRARL